MVASYEISAAANQTNNKNNQHLTHTLDLRRLNLDDLPRGIDICVGSPPCTQFSFSNRGGSGDLNDGLEDILRFLAIVDRLKPKYWAMENVPRVAKIIESNLRHRGRLAKFEHLGITPHIVNMADFGLPQRRRRCIAGNFDFALLSSYKKGLPKRTLGDVVSALARNPVRDPIFGFKVSQSNLHDHVPEASLTDEEARINRAGKLIHPVYNAMPFPEPMNRGVRTITATCTRVSRESIIIERPDEPTAYRRLTIRERASLQGFPITFQFYADGYSQKLRMIGNAIPPPFTYFIGHAFVGTPADSLRPIHEVAGAFTNPKAAPPVTTPDRTSSRYRKDRTFRFSIPSLRLKSGVRYELANACDSERQPWKVSFYFGTSKTIKSLRLDKNLYSRVLRRIPKTVDSQVRNALAGLSVFVRGADLESMQRLWSHNGFGRTPPFELLDRIDAAGSALIALLESKPLSAQVIVADEIVAQYHRSAGKLPGLKKLERNAVLILAGMLVGALVNVDIAQHFEKPLADRRQRAAA